MSDLQRYRPGGTVAISKEDANPEGKGDNGFLLDWYRTAPRGVVAKPRRQVLAEFFTSMLVLSARFGYKPAVGVPNYLYWVRGEWSLSLIAPAEWSDERRTGFAGTCVLHPDMTWTIDPSGRLAGDNAVSDAVGRFYDAFAEALNTDLTLEEILPFCAGRLAYYQRLYAAALSRSIRAAVTLGERKAVSCRDWRDLLPRLENLLPAAHPARGAPPQSPRPAVVGKPPQRRSKRTRPAP